MYLSNLGVKGLNRKIPIRLTASVCNAQGALPTIRLCDTWIYDDTFCTSYCAREGRGREGGGKGGGKGEGRGEGRGREGGGKGEGRGREGGGKGEGGTALQHLPCAVPDLASTAAPCSSNSLTHFTWPSRDARCRAVFDDSSSSLRMEGSFFSSSFKHLRTKGNIQIRSDHFNLRSCSNDLSLNWNSYQAGAAWHGLSQIVYYGHRNHGKVLVVWFQWKEMLRLDQPLLRSCNYGLSLDCNSYQLG